MTEVQVGFVKYFKFSEESSREALDPHPQEGRIYRIIKLSKKDKKPFYQLYIGKENNKAGMDCIYLGDTLEGEYNDKWEFSIQTITKENYLEYQYAEEDLVALKNWLESDHADLRKLIKNKSPNPVNLSQQIQQAKEDDIYEKVPLTSPIEEALKKVVFAERTFEESVNRLQVAINNLLENDIGLVTSVSEALDHISRYHVSAPNEMNLGKQFLMNSKSPDAAIFIAISSLNNYTHNYENKKQFNKLDLYMAIYHCLLELQRRQTQDTI